mmetsp:Transcript_10159/g.18537  ORF Transcript_10159/g.18537 Transcript_10159/m.18537 type:complete len:283 (-) Transcript_10159:151-999(-)
MHKLRNSRVQKFFIALLDLLQCAIIIIEAGGKILYVILPVYVNDFIPTVSIAEFFVSTHSWHIHLRPCVSAFQRISVHLLEQLARVVHHVRVESPSFIPRIPFFERRARDLIPFDIVDNVVWSILDSECVKISSCSLPIYFDAIVHDLGPLSREGQIILDKPQATVVGKLLAGALLEFIDNDGKTFEVVSPGQSLAKFLEMSHRLQSWEFFSHVFVVEEVDAVREYCVQLLDVSARGGDVHTAFVLGCIVNGKNNVRIGTFFLDFFESLHHVLPRLRGSDHN